MDTRRQFNRDQEVRVKDGVSARILEGRGR